MMNHGTSAGDVLSPTTTSTTRIGVRGSLAKLEQLLWILRPGFYSAGHTSRVVSGTLQRVLNDGARVP